MSNTPPGMTRLYENPGLPGRPTLSIVVVCLAAVYGAFELWRAWRNDFASQMDVLFGLFFIGGGIYGFNRTWTDARDAVLTLDVDAAGQRAAISLWRPFRPLAIETGTEGLSGWRHLVKVGPRDLKTHVVVAACAGYPRPIRFDFPNGLAIPEGLRALAPEAIADYEEATGAKPAD